MLDFFNNVTVIGLQYFFYFFFFLSIFLYFVILYFLYFYVGFLPTCPLRGAWVNRWTFSPLPLLPSNL